MMKKTLWALAVLSLTSCGYTAIGNEMTGQVKKVVNNTPLVCPPYSSADVSLGVMRNGVGSMSHEDVELYVPSELDRAALKAAAESGALVKIKYSVARVTFCVPEHVVQSVEEIK